MHNFFKQKLKTKLHNILDHNIHDFFFKNNKWLQLKKKGIFMRLSSSWITVSGHYTNNFDFKPTKL